MTETDARSILLNQKHGNTPLHYAAQSGSVQCILQLIATGRVQVDDMASKGDTPLMRAVPRGHVDAARALLAAGADVNKITINGWTALGLAVSTGNADHALALADMLLAAGADPNAKDSRGITPMTFACRDGRDKVVKLLLKYRADVNARSKAGQTALTYAAHEGRLECVKLLVAAGCDVNSVDNQGLSALQAASMQKQQSVVDLLTPLVKRSVHVPAGAADPPAAGANARAIPALQRPARRGWFGCLSS